MANIDTILYNAMPLKFKPLLKISRKASSLLNPNADFRLRLTSIVNFLRERKNTRIHGGSKLPSCSISEN